jgi:Plasma-membrane choline transporter
MIRSVRDNGGCLIACCAECLLGCIESLVEYFNKWAYIYVGLYGFSFMEAGSNVMTLFRNRGWSVIVADMMVDTVLFMVSIGVGAITALLTTAIGYLMGDGYLMDNRDATALVIAAAFGFIVGYAMSSSLFSVVSSAVNTVIVCYAEAPNEFQANHPKLSDQMRTAWRQAYPNEFGY